MCMGEPIKWKNPNNAKMIYCIGDLADYEDKILDWVARVLQHFKTERVYVDGLPNGIASWWDGSDIGEELADEAIKRMERY